MIGALDRHLDLYIRSLAEREQPRSAPQNRQDLGTLLTWLLRAEGHDVLVPAYRYEGAQRSSNVGYDQGGVDLFTTREDDGVPTLYRFIVKAKNITKRNFVEAGGIQEDLQCVYKRNAASDRWVLGLAEGQPFRVETVVVNNGNVESELLAEATATWSERFQREGQSLDWWDAERLVGKVKRALADEATDAASIFPPAVQPFAGLLLDGLRVFGQELPMQAAPEDVSERTVAATRLALDHWLDGETRRGGGYDVSKPLQAKRAAAEVALFCALAERAARLSDPVPWFDLIYILEHAMCRLADCHRQGQVAHLTEGLALLAEQYGGVMADIAEALTPVAEIEDALALLGSSEVIDYPIRTWRLVGRMAAGWQLAQDLRNRSDAAMAERADVLADGVARIVSTTGQTAVRTPVTDDVVAELIVVAEVLIATGRSLLLGDWMKDTLIRLNLRRLMNLPGPSTWHRSRMPVEPAVAQELAAVWQDANASRAALGFTDAGSVFLAVCVWLLARLGWWDEEVWQVFRGQKLEGLGDDVSSVTPQLWSAPEDPWSRWYRQEITEDGVAHLLEHEVDAVAFSSAVEATITAVRESPMAGVGLHGVDAVASLVWRHPGTLAELSALLGAGKATR